MKNRILMYTIFTVSIIVLLSLSSAICKISKNSNSENLIELEIEFCGIGKNHNIKITKEAIEEIKLIFDEIRYKINNSKSREESVLIVNHAIEELEKYGFLGDLSIKEAQSLVNGKFYAPDMDIIYERLIKYKSSLGNNTNLLCIVTGETNSLFYGPTSRFLNGIGLLLIFVGGSILLTINMLLVLANMKNPIQVGSTITYGAWAGDYYPSEGWVTTSGLKGNLNWETPIYGRLLRFPLYSLIALGYPGITGFTGLKFEYEAKTYYLGFGLLVNLGSKPPFHFNK